MRTLVPQTLLILGLLPALLPGAPPAVEATRSTLAKWVETRQLIARLQSDWAQDRETLGSAIALFESQRDRLDAAIAGLGQDNELVAMETADNDRQLKAQLAALEKVEALIVGYEKRLRAVLPNFPPPLLAREQVSKILALVPADPEKTDAQLISRVQNLILILKAVQEFNGDLHLENEVRRRGGQELQVRTLYLGLGQAWFVDASGTFAGTGGPSAEGWAWKEMAEIAPHVRQAIAIYEKSQPAVYVALPAEVK